MCTYQHTSQLCTTSDLFSTAPVFLIPILLKLYNNEFDWRIQQRKGFVVDKTNKIKFTKTFKTKQRNSTVNHLNTESVDVITAIINDATADVLIGDESFFSFGDIRWPII